jgi:hypothetical protein
MIRIEPFSPEHLARFVPRPDQKGDAERLHGRTGAAAELGPAFTAYDEEDNVIGCAGLAENSPDYATAWALFADGVRPALWARLAGAIQSVLSASGYRRIDTLVRADFPAGHRFVEALGFEREMVLFVRRDQPLFDRMRVERSSWNNGVAEGGQDEGEA